MADWVDAEKKRILQRRLDERVRRERLESVAASVNSMVLNKMSAMNSSFLGGAGSVLDYSVESILPADSAMTRLLAPRYYYETVYSALKPVVWRLLWHPHHYPSDWASISVTLVPPADEASNDWKFAVSINPFDLQCDGPQVRLAGEPERDSHLTEGISEEDLDDALHAACARGRELML